MKIRATKNRQPKKKSKKEDEYIRYNAKNLKELYYFFF